MYSQEKKIPDFFSSSVKPFVKRSMVASARATPFTTDTTSSVLGTPDGSRTDFRTSQGEVSGFRRGTGTKGILASQAVEGHDTEGFRVSCISSGLMAAETPPAIKSGPHERANGSPKNEAFPLFLSV